MKNHFFLKTMLIAALGVAPVIAQAKQEVQKTAMAQNSNKTMSAMTPAEQQFAMKLSALHRQIFMTVFTPDLRKEAMAIMTSPDNEDEDMPMTEDMAVEQVITNHRDVQMKSGSMNNGQPMTTPKAQTQSSKSTKKSYWN